jgi:hypothetical protein
LASLGCLLAAACSPSIDPAAKADIDARVLALPRQPRDFAAPTNPTPMPFAVGQWVTYRYTDGKGQPSFMTLKLVGQEGPAFWYETLSESYYGRQASRMLIDFGDRRTVDSITIKAAKMRDSKGRINEIPDNMVGLMNSILRGKLGPIVIDWTGLPQENVAVVGGRFAGCFKGHSKVSWGGFSAQSDVWGHPAVPFSGMVRSQGDNDVKGELVGFGLQGAKSEF